MLRVTDVFSVGSLYSITLQGDCESVQNGTLLQAKDGRSMVVQSVAMLNSGKGLLDSEITVLSATNSLPKGTTVEVA